MIPKIIHYCWFGGAPLPQLLNTCIDSWKAHCPDWQIIRWDESNSPQDIPFVRQAYKHRKWAFVSDYVRVYALYNMGGVYLDTDMLLTRPIDSFCQHRAFFGRQEEDIIGCGIFGFEKGHPFCAKWLEYYQSLTFNMAKPPMINSEPTAMLFARGMVGEDISQLLDGDIAIYPTDWFYPIPLGENIDINTCQQYFTPNTHAAHLWYGSWAKDDEIIMLDREEYKKGFSLAWQRIKRTPFLPLRYYKKLLKYALVYMHLYPKD